MNDHIPKETEVGQKLRNNNIGAGKTRQHVRELRDTFYKYYSDDPSVISRYIDDVNIASAVGSNEDYTDSDTPLETPNEPYLFGNAIFDEVWKINEWHGKKSCAQLLSFVHFQQNYFMVPIPFFFISIYSVSSFFDFSEMNLLWHEYHSLKKDEKWLLENCLASMSKCRTDDMALRSNMRGKNDPNKSSTQKKNNKDSRTESDYDTSEERSATGTNDATSEIEGHEAAHLLGSSESYYHDLQNNILVPRVTHPLQQLLKTFTYSHSYQRKLMYSGLPLLLYQVQPHLNSEVQILRSQMSANDESTMEKRRELKQQNQLLKAVSRKQKEVQLLVDHIQQCIQYKKQSSMNMNYIPSLLRWVSIVRRYGGVDPFPSVRDIEVPLTDARNRRQRHKEARARNADGLPSLTKPDSNPSSDNDNDDNQRTPLAGVTSYSIKLFNRGSVSDAFHWVIFTTFGLRIYEAIVIIMIMVLPTCIDIAINTPYCAVQIYRFVSRFCVPWLMKIQKNPNHRSATRSASNPQPSHSNVQCGADIKGDNNNSWFLTFTISAMHFVLSTVGVIVTLYAQFGFLIVPLVPLVFFLGLFERNFIEPLFDLVTGKGRGMFSNYITSSYRRVDESTIEIWFTVWAVVTRVQKISIFVVLTFLWAFLAYFVLRPMYRFILDKGRGECPWPAVR